MTKNRKPEARRSQGQVSTEKSRNRRNPQQGHPDVKPNPFAGSSCLKRLQTDYRPVLGTHLGSARLVAVHRAADRIQPD